MTRTERGTCARCGGAMWKYHGTDGDFWVHDEATQTTLTHLATDKVPDVVAEVADERRKEHVFIWPENEPDDSPTYDAGLRVFPTDDGCRLHVWRVRSR